MLKPLAGRAFLYQRLWSPLRALLGKLVGRLVGSNPRLLNRLGLLSQHMDAALFGVVPAPECLRTPPEKRADLGLNVAGFVKREFGLGEASRAIIKAVDTAGIPYVVNNIIIPGHGQLADTVENLSTANPYPVNLIHVNAAEASAWFRHRRWRDYLQDRYNIGYWFWELSRFPEEWSDGFRYLDEIWVATTFCLEAVSNVSPVPVVRVVPCMYMDESRIDPRRSRFGLAENAYTFLFAFDFHSSFKRKNPLALVEAFKMAFSNSDDAVLVVKCTNSASYPQYRQALDKAASGASVRIIDAILGKDELNSLVAACDCYVSLHRAEGFGLPIAEAMYLGKPAIATGYSGNMDFMTPDNSFAVRYELVDISPTEYPPYNKGYVWAEPDVAHAAELMRSVYDNRDHAVKVGERAARDIRSLFNPSVAGQEIRRRLETVLAGRPQTLKEEV